MKTDKQLEQVYENLVLVREFLENELEPDELISKTECLEIVRNTLFLVNEECIKRRFAK